MIPPNLACFVVSALAFSQGFIHSNDHNKNGLKIPSDIKNSSRTKVTEFKSYQKGLVAYKNATSKECKVQFLNENDQDSLKVLNLKNKLRTKTALSANEVAEIVGESVIKFCGYNVIVFANDQEIIRSKRSTDRKRYQGQTQTQFVSFGPNNNKSKDAKNGVAEALSQPELSKATVSGTNGMGQAQSQSSVSDCEECYGQSVRGSQGAYSQENPTPFAPQSAFIDGQRAKPLLGTNVNGQYPSVYDHRGRPKPSYDDRYPASGNPASKPSQDGSTKFPSGEQYPRGKLNTDQPTLVTGSNPSYINEKYPSLPAGQNTPISNPYSGINPISGEGLQPNGQTPSGHSGPEAFPNNVGNSDNKNIIGSGASNEPIDRSRETPNQGLGLGAFSSNGQIPYGQRPGVINPSDLYSNLRNPYDNSQQVSRNSYPIYPSSGNSPGLTYQSYPANVANVPSTQQAFPSGSGFPGFPSGFSHGIIAPHYVPTMENVNFKFPDNSYQRNSGNQQNIPNGNIVGQSQYQPEGNRYPPSSNFQVPDNQQTGRPFIGDGSYPQNPPSKITYPSFLNPLVGQNTNQYSLPSLCSFIYQTCLNALANIKESNGYFTPNNYPQTSYTGQGKYLGAYEQNLAASNRSPQGTLNGETAGTPQFGFVQPGNNENNGYNALSPDLSKNVGTGGQQPNYIQNGNGFNPNLGQAGINIPYPSSIGNSGYGNQAPIYNKPSQSSIGNTGPGVQQPGTGLNLNSWQGGTNVRYPSSIENTESSVQQPNFQQPGSGLNPNLGQIGTNVPYPNSYGNIVTSNKQPKANDLYPNPFGNFGTGNQQSSYNGPSSGVIGNVGPDIQQPGSVPNPNLGQPGANLPYPSSYSNFGIGNQHPDLGQLGANVRYPSSYGTLGPGNQQPNFNGPFSDITGNVGPVIQQPGSVPNANLGQPGINGPYPSSYDTLAPGNQQPYYSGPSSSGNFGTGQQPNQGQSSSSGSFPSSVNVKPGDTGNTKNPLDMQNGPQNNNANTIPSIGLQQYGPGPQKETTESHLLQNGGQLGGAGVSSGGQVTSVDAEEGEGQSLTSVNVDGVETSASASSQGKSKNGMTQTQVSGSYSGTGTFSAQAQTSDSDKGAQSNIASNTNGTTSTAQGRGGKGRAQSQIHYDLESGVALGEAQSSGADYATNTQLQAGIKGGIADAQSSGVGGTSSQAQIGFLPHDSSNNAEQKSLFKGGGTASAQGGARSGLSQSQLSGSYKYGISYNGAAQASSGKKLQGLPKLTVDDAKAKIDRLGEGLDSKQTQKPLQHLLNTVRNELKVTSTQTPPVVPSASPRDVDEDDDDNPEEYNEEYEDEKETKVDTTSEPTRPENIPAQTQNVFLNLADEQDVQIIRDSDDKLNAGQVLDAGQVIPGTNGTRVPDGLRARVASTAGDRTEAKAAPGGQAQTQTVLLSPGGGLTVVDKTKFRALMAKESYVAPKSFQTDLNGETGKYRPKDNNVQYFTKSSTCGYFSFSCNYIDGAKGGAKICKPNPPPFPCKRN